MAWDNVLRKEFEDQYHDFCIRALPNLFDNFRRVLYRNRHALGHLNVDAT